jgi:hypothetical protein
MNDSPPHDSAMLNARIKELKPEAAEKATQMFLESHPDWLIKYGDRARKFGIEDAQHHIDFLVGALEADSIQAFVEYCAWAVEVLESRAIARCFLIENLTQIENALSSGLSPEEQAVVARFMEAGRLACMQASSGPEQSSSPGRYMGPVSPMQ